MGGDVVKASGSMLSRFARSRARGRSGARCEAHVETTSIPRPKPARGCPAWRSCRDVRFWPAGLRLPLVPGLEVALTGTRISTGAANLVVFFFFFVFK